MDEKIEEKSVGKKSSLRTILIIIASVLIVGGGVTTYLLLGKKTVKTEEGTVTYDKDNVTVESKDGVTTSTGKNLTLPASWPKIIPVYKKGTLTTISNEGNNGLYIMTTKDTAATIMPWFKTELTKAGWTIDIESADRFDFRNSTQAGTVFVDKDSDGNNTINVNIMNKNDIGVSSSTGENNFDAAANEIVESQN